MVFRFVGLAVCPVFGEQPEALEYWAFAVQSSFPERLGIEVLNSGLSAR